MCPLVDQIPQKLLNMDPGYELEAEWELVVEELG